MGKKQITHKTKQKTIIQAEKGFCAKCHQPFSKYRQPGGSYAYQNTQGQWVTGMQCTNCANQVKQEKTYNNREQTKSMTRLIKYYESQNFKPGNEDDDWKKIKPKKPKKKPGRKPRKKRGPYGTGFGREKTWKQHWATDPKLRKLFKGSYRGLRRFASSYGYGIGNIHELKKHKETRAGK